MRSGELRFDRGTLMVTGGGLLIESKWDQYQINCTNSVTRMAQRIKRIDDGVWIPQTFHICPT